MHKSSIKTALWKSGEALESSEKVTIFMAFENKQFTISLHRR